MMIIKLLNLNRIQNLKIKFSYFINTGWVKKSRPPTSFIDIFASAQSFCIKFCTFIGNINPRMCTDYRSFILTFSEMALILLRAPIIFMVSSFDCSAISVLCKNAECKLTGNDVIVFVIKCLVLCKQMIDFLHRLLFYKVFKVIDHTNGKVVLWW